MWSPPTVVLPLTSIIPVLISSQVIQAFPAYVESRRDLQANLTSSEFSHAATISPFISLPL